jgi:hypothetical protein
VHLGKHLVLYDDEGVGWEFLDLSAQPVLTGLTFSSSDPTLSLTGCPVSSSSSSFPSSSPILATSIIFDTNILPVSTEDVFSAPKEEEVPPAMSDRVKLSTEKSSLSAPSDSGLILKSKIDKSGRVSKEKDVDETEQKVKVRADGREKHAIRDASHVYLKEEEVEKRNKEKKLKRIEKEGYSNRTDRKKDGIETGQKVLSQISSNVDCISTAPVVTIINPIVLAVLPSLEKRIKKRQRESDHDSDHDNYSTSSDYHPVTSKISKVYRR